MVNILVNKIDYSLLEFFRICLTFENKNCNIDLWGLQCRYNI